MHPACDYQLFGDGSESPGGVGDDEELDGPPTPLSPAHRGMQLAPVPHLDVRPLPLADALAAELMRETAGRDRFLTVTPADLYHSAETFVRYRLTSLDIIRRADRGACRMSLSDLRELGRRSPP